MFLRETALLYVPNTFEVGVLCVVLGINGMKGDSYAAHAGTKLRCRRKEHQ